MRDLSLEEGASAAEMRTEIPNEHMLPHLHVLAFRRNQRIEANPLLSKADATEETLLQNVEELSNTREKLLAIFKLLLNGDSLAAEYLLYSWLSTVHTRKDAFILGSLPLNLSGLTFQ